MSAIDGYISNIQNAVYGEQVRSSIVNALLQCYSDVNNPSLQTEAFTAAGALILIRIHVMGMLNPVRACNLRSHQVPASHSHLSSHYRFSNRMHLVCPVVPAHLFLHDDYDHLFPVACLHKAVR